MVALLDSVVVVGFLDRDDGFHEAADACLRRHAGRDRLVVSVITYAALLTGAQLGHHEQVLVRGFFRELVDQVHAVDPEVAERAAELRAEKRGLKMPDALILATADVHRVDVVVTGDERWAAAGIEPRVEVLTPSEP